MSEVDCTDPNRRRVLRGGAGGGSAGISSFSDFTCYPDRYPSRRTSYQDWLGLPAVLTPNASLSPSTTPISTPVASPGASPWGEVAPGSSPNHPPTGIAQNQAANSNPNNNSLSHCHVIQSGSSDPNPKVDQKSYYTILPDSDARIIDRHNLEVFQSSRVRLSSQGEVDDKALFDVKDSPAFQSQLLHKVPRRRMSSAPTGYSFFDYSMIPDKMDSSRQSLQIPKKFP